MLLHAERAGEIKFRRAFTFYVIQGVRGEGTINEVFQGTISFFISMIVMTGLLIHFLQMALWLPQLAFAK